MPVTAFLDGPEGMDAVSFEDLMIATLNRTSNTRMGLPVIASIVAGMTTKNRPDASAGFSASQFSSCARKIILEQRYDTADRPEAQYWMSRGTLVHKVIEDALEALPAWLRPFFVSEQRLYTEFSLFLEGHDETVTVGVHGQFDLCYLPPSPEQRMADMRLAALPDYAILFDHKNKKFMPKEPQEEHIWQVSIYAWLMWRNGWEQVPRTGAINYMDNGSNIEFRVPLKSYEEVEEHLARKLQELAPALLYGSLPDRVGPEGRWCCGLNKTKTSYCPFTARCWPKGIGTDADGFSSINSPQPEEVAEEVKEVGSGINWAHPLARGLVSAWPLDEIGSAAWSNKRCEEIMVSWPLDKE